MNEYLPSLVLVAIAAVLLLSGCDLVTENAWRVDRYCQAFPEDCLSPSY